MRVSLYSIVVMGLLSFFVMSSASANPVFARQYEMSCTACHAAFPRLNEFGKSFIANNIRLPNWKDQAVVDTGDDDLFLLKLPPVGFRVQAYGQIREADAVDSSGNVVAKGDDDIQAPYLIKLFSAAPLTDHFSYYFYAMLAEKGHNGTILVEDAWIRHDDAFGTGSDVTIGQFQLSDLMFPRETRLTFQDFIPYRMADITYQRGGYLEHGLGAFDVAIGAVNGNGIDANEKINSGGYQRADRAFDNNRTKTLFGRIGTEIASVDVGLFLSDGTKEGMGDTRVTGLDISGVAMDNLYWFAQFLDVNWSNVTGVGDASWYGGFAGVDYIYDKHWAYSLLYNYADANDLANSGTVYEGIDLNTLTATVNYYFASNVKGVIELTVDLQSEDGVRDGIGHDTKEGYFLVGLDAGF